MAEDKKEVPPKIAAITSEAEALAAEQVVMEFRRQQQVEQAVESAKDVLPIIDLFKSGVYQSIRDAHLAVLPNLEYGSMDRMNIENVLNAINGMESFLKHRYADAMNPAVDTPVTPAP